MAVRVASKRFEYILEGDRESDAPTVFQIRELSGIERGEVRRILLLPKLPENANNDELKRMDIALSDAYQSVCRIGLESAAPIVDADGKIIDLPIKDVLSGLIYPDAVQELALAVLLKNQLESSEKKKSETPPAPGRQD